MCLMFTPLCRFTIVHNRQNNGYVSPPTPWSPFTTSSPSTPSLSHISSAPHTPLRVSNVSWKTSRFPCDRRDGTKKWHESITHEKMHILKEWLFEVVLTTSTSVHTLSLCVNIMHTFFSTYPSLIPIKDLQLYGSACIFIAHKIEEVGHLTGQDVVFFTDNTYTVDELILAEETILSTLNYSTPILSLASRKLKRKDGNHFARATRNTTHREPLYYIEKALQSTEIHDMFSQQVVLDSARALSNGTELSDLSPDVRQCIKKINSIPPYPVLECAYVCIERLSSAMV